MEMTKAQSKVIRNGAIESINSEDVVVGDVLVVEAGDSVPADCRIIESYSLKVEESALTGESVAVEKFDYAISDDNIVKILTQYLQFSKKNFKNK